jgi:hypothetical protein
LKEGSLLPFRRHLTFANVAAALALFVALGGTGYAAISLPRNSVGPAQLQRAAVTSSKIHASAVGRAALRSNAVGSSEIRTDAVGNSEIRRGGVRSSEIRDGSVTSTDIANGTIAPADLSAATVAAFQAPLLRVAVNADGTVAAGEAKVAHDDTKPGVYTVTFTRDVSKCFYSATLQTTLSDTGDVTNPRANISVASGGTAVPDDANVVVRTFNDASPTDPLDEPFHLIVVC